MSLPARRFGCRSGRASKFLRKMGEIYSIYPSSQLITQRPIIRAKPAGHLLGRPRKRTDHATHSDKSSHHGSPDQLRSRDRRSHPWAQDRASDTAGKPHRHRPADQAVCLSRWHCPDGIDPDGIDPDTIPDIGKGFGWHPHSGIATVSLLFDGTIFAVDSTGMQADLESGAVAWFMAGGGAWHGGKVLEPVGGYQLWGRHASGT